MSSIIFLRKLSSSENYLLPKIIIVKLKLSYAFFLAKKRERFFERKGGSIWYLHVISSRVYYSLVFTRRFLVRFPPLLWSVGGTSEFVDRRLVGDVLLSGSRPSGSLRHLLWIFHSILFYTFTFGGDIQRYMCEVSFPVQKCPFFFLTLT